ncbi:T9SS-dependent M36 family metallopeptidase [uncultured Lacinutrix sp.]|uniref:T9SS-dependent M36 family metallopeptidase n=1 Tax=uncultured Lacinutrix sp. TaxID=574032 RepID=UPI002601B453|nr:T9SS-dependent M36 family metallopeptidase [uncultured Lacinutrix sp.]
MKKKYFLKIFILALLFAPKGVDAQNSLADNQYGSIIQNWLDAKKGNFNLTDNDVLDLQVSDAYFSNKTNINHVYVNQAYQGVKIYNAISSVAIRDNSVFHYANAFVSNINSKINTTSTSINPQEAISSVVSHYNLGNLSNIETISSNGNSYLFSNGGVSKEDIPVSLVYQVVEDGTLKLAWDLSIRTLNGSNWYSVRVDAVSGEVLNTIDWIVSCNFGDANHTNHESHLDGGTHGVNLFKENRSIMPGGTQYNVLALPAESPNHGPFQLLADPSNAVASPFGWHDTNGVAGAEFTITRGNNVWAQEDADGNDGTGISAEGGSTLNFNFPFNENQEPIGYRDASLTNLFYMNNIMHDIWYQYGFDEASGNFQQNNYGNGGAGGDFVFADGQDGSGLNNATFGTPPDGGNPGMTMFLWAATGPPGQPLTINNSTVAGDYTGTKATFGTPLTTTVTADLALLTDDNSGVSTDANDACDTVTNGPALMGKIVVLNRGECEFGFKVLSAENQGAVGVIVVNNSLADIIPMGGGAVGAQVTIPSIMISLLDGQNIINALNNGETINASLVPAAPYQKDGSLDNGIVAHEYGHGISTRLAGGPGNSGCLGNAEQMGEGWSDWFGLMITMTASDVGDAARGIGTFATGQPITGGGIRPFPYSTDTTVNPLTYANTNDANISQPHGIGTVWSTMLWDLTWKYIEKYGFNADLYNGTGGNNKIMQLVLDGLKLQPCGAGFVDGRDALLAADIALTNGEDQCMIWEVFAARGVGVNASQGTAASRSDQVEDFTMLPATDASLQNCTALSVDEFALNSQYSIYPNPANDILNIKVKKNFGEVTMSLTDINGRSVLSKTVNLSDETQLNIGALQSGMYILTIKGEGINTNDKILKN